MSRYEKQLVLQDSQQIRFLLLAIFALFSIVFFFSFGIPALRTTYGSSHLISINNSQ